MRCCSTKACKRCGSDTCIFLIYLLVSILYESNQYSIDIWVRINIHYQGINTPGPKTCALSPIGWFYFKSNITMETFWFWTKFYLTKLFVFQLISLQLNDFFFINYNFTVNKGDLYLHYWEKQTWRTVIIVLIYFLNSGSEVFK